MQSHLRSLRVSNHYCDAVEVDSDRFIEQIYTFFAFGTDSMLANFSIGKFTGSVVVRAFDSKNHFNDRPRKNVSFHDDVAVLQDIELRVLNFGTGKETNRHLAAVT